MGAQEAGAPRLGPPRLALTLTAGTAPPAARTWAHVTGSRACGAGRAKPARGAPEPPGGDCVARREPCALPCGGSGPAGSCAARAPARSQRGARAGGEARAGGAAAGDPGAVPGAEAAGLSPSRGTPRGEFPPLSPAGLPARRSVSAVRGFAACGQCHPGKSRPRCFWASSAGWKVGLSPRFRI